MLLRVLQILACITVMVICYYGVIWVLGLLGVHIPPQILTAVFVLLGLICAIGIVTGRFDTISWWRVP
jgi:hypothetical protein